MFTYRGKTALITGASSGIGAHFAKMLAQRGADVILVARREDKLNSLAYELAQQHNVQTHVLAADLSQENAAQTVFAQTQERGLHVDILINNAGFATHGQFEELDQARDHEQVMLNVTAVVDLSHAFLPAMLVRGDGAIINVASTAAFQPLPYMAVYGATKAFVVSFSEALWAEYQGRGVRVLALCPGATDTPFFEVVGAQEAVVGQKLSPEYVVQVGLDALEAGKSYVIPGTQHYLLAQVPRFVPRALAARIVARLARPRSPEPATPIVRNS
jgi:hypothetical protein